MVDVERCIALLMGNRSTLTDQQQQRKLLPARLLQAITQKVIELLAQEPNVLHLQAPVTVVGDVHGQLDDVLDILLHIAGPPPDTNYLFLGDYVDRGFHSLETISLLLCLKLRWPHRVTLLRGNHESRAVTQTYGFYSECLRKYGHDSDNGSAVWRWFCEVFDYLALAVVIDQDIVCVHGGLSPSIHTLDQIRIIDRFKEIPHEGPMADLVWSDPDPDPDKDGWGVSPRGAGYTFGRTVVETFLHTNTLSHILRAHQLCMEGYQVLYNDQLSTVWSAPNYCYRCGNLASVLQVGPAPTLARYFNVFAAASDLERERDRHCGLERQIYAQRTTQEIRTEQDELQEQSTHNLESQQSTSNWGQFYQWTTDPDTEFKSTTESITLQQHINQIQAISQGTTNGIGQYFT